MAEPITLQYGGRTLSLAKSERLVAVRPRPGMEAPLARALEAMPGVAAAGPGKDTNFLGGFRIVELSAAAPGAAGPRALEALRRDPAVAVASHIYHTSEDNVPFVPTGELFIEFRPEAAAGAKRELMDRLKLQVVEGRDENTVIARTTPASPNPVRAAAELQRSEIVAVAEPDLATPGSLRAFALPTDPLLGDQWHLQNRGRFNGDTVFGTAGADARVVDAWTRGRSLGAPEIVVAVIDDGFDLDHPDLGGPGKIVHPWDFTRGTGSPGPDAAAQDWHGTACAGVAVGRAGGGGVLGAAPGARLMPVRWGRDLSDRQVELWFDHVTRNGADVVSCSWGAAAKFFPLGTRRARAIQRCAREGRGGKGCVVVFAAGNSNHDINDPANGTLDGFAVHPDVIAVAASNSLDRKSDYSNFGREIWVCAPSSGAGAWGILTSDVTGTGVVNGQLVPLGYAPDDYTYDFGGTSSACPLVAGVCALVLTANPGLTAREVCDVLARTARRIGPASAYKNGRSRHFGHGCVDAAAAVALAASMAEQDGAAARAVA